MMVIFTKQVLSSSAYLLQVNTMNESEPLTGKICLGYYEISIVQPNDWVSIDKDARMVAFASERAILLFDTRKMTMQERLEYRETQVIRLLRLFLKCGKIHLAVFSSNGGLILFDVTQRCALWTCEIGPRSIADVMLGENTVHLLSKQFIISTIQNGKEISQYGGRSREFSYTGTPQVFEILYSGYIVGCSSGQLIYIPNDEEDSVTILDSPSRSSVTHLLKERLSTTQLVQL
ncbi:hypothetical protein AB6A40_000842 [Gnathostoma spinigerum]|uniref:Uncharacterized protein n=1 Tax=Gnathostoma spinigerum TaxID=75299 RepID=A0ABD6E304_9BILA